MFRLALRDRDVWEMLGQVVRLAVAAPGSAAGKCPDGNTGRTRAGSSHAGPGRPGCPAPRGRCRVAAVGRPARSVVLRALRSPLCGGRRARRAREPGPFGGPGRGSHA
ncbi:DUF3703 domain-containing protein [Streptomyces sp. NPDC056347]|uniref:DUF3703 domain-containing protein n=1 Tax=Streptomyces sp. NPDC056347 TaxID=3345790 RepID=UPI0035D9F469